MYGQGHRCLIRSIYAAVLFVLLSPGILISLPPRGSLMTKVLVHGLVFFLVLHCTKNMVCKFFCRNFLGDREYFEDKENYEDDEEDM